MIRSVRRVDAVELAAHLSNAALVHTRMRLHAVENTGVVNEDKLLMRAYARAGRVERPTLTVLLDGEARISAHDRHVWLEPGDVVSIDSKSAIEMRQAGSPYASLAFEWEPGFVGRRGAPIESWRANGEQLDRLREIWRAVRADGNPAEVIESLLAALAELGAPLDRHPAAALVEIVPERMQDLAHALDVILSKLDEQPMMLDLEGQLDLQARQVNRLVASYNERYGFNSTGWIDTRNRRRLMFGATFMTAAGASVSYVARVVGYQSAGAFVRALRSAGLPPPSEIAKEVEAIAKATRQKHSRS